MANKKAIAPSGPWVRGWKDIGKHFGVTWQTAREWHKEYGLPVLRTPNGSPIQFPEILDEWLIEFNRIKAEWKGGIKTSGAVCDGAE